MSFRAPPSDEASAAARLDGLHRMAAALTHDFNNLLGVILTSSQTLAAELDEGSHRALALVGLQAAERSAELLKRLMALSEDCSGGVEDVECGAALAALRPLARQAIPAGVALRISPPAHPLPCRADPVGLEVALLNLALNAGQATPLGGRVGVSARRVRLAAGDAAPLGLAAGTYAALAVRDTGCGMDAETLKRAREPLFTTRARGHGLGLPSVVDFAAEAHGALALSSQKGRGTTATLYLPLAEPAEIAATRRRRPAAPIETPRAFPQ